MRIGIVSDIHSNFVALKTVLDHMGSVDALWCLGDLVGYGPQPNECVYAVGQYPHLSIPGNHDWGTIGNLSLDEFNREARSVLEWTHRMLAPEHVEYLKGLPLTVSPGEPSFTMVHASPRDPMWEYLLDLFDAAECFPLFKTRYLLVGHTHVPLIFRDALGVVKAIMLEPGEKMRLNVQEVAETEDPTAHGARMIINPGSVGQPRDGDPRAAYMVLEMPDEPRGDAWPATLSFQRVEYAVGETQALMRSLNFPERLAARLEVGL